MRTAIDRLADVLRSLQDLSEDPEASMDTADVAGHLVKLREDVDRIRADVAELRRQAHRRD